MRRFLNVEMVAGILLASSVVGNAALQHRYSFDADASDSVGAANGTLEGTTGSITGGRVELPGGGIDATNAYVSLPGPTIAINTYTQVTLQAWFRFDAVAGNFQKLFAFGGTQTTGGLEWAGKQYLIAGLRQGGGGPSDAAISNAQEGDGDPWTEEANVVGPNLSVGDHHIAVVVDDTIIAIYVDGVLAQTDVLSSSPTGASLDQVSNDLAYLGRSVYADALMGGAIDEFRIYDTRLSSLDIGIDFALGPDDASGDPGTASGHAVVGEDTLVIESVKQQQLTITFSKFAEPVTFNQDPGLAWASSDTNIATISDAGLLVGISTGTVTVTATYGGVPTTKQVTVTDRALVHRYSFNGAADSSFDFIEPDLVGTADGTVFYAERLGDGTVNLVSGLSGYVDLPNGIISALGSGSFETWVTPREIGLGWQRIWDFGTTTLGELDEDTLGGYDGSEFIFLTARRGDAASLSFEYSGAQNVILGPGYTFGEELHLVVSYNTDAGESILYLNGVPIGSDTGTPLMAGLPDVNNWLGRSQYANDGFLDALFNEFRVYEGVLTPQEVAVNYATGPDGTPFTEPGTLVSLTLLADTTSLIAAGPGEQTSALADFTQVAGVPIGGLDGVTYRSDDTNVVIISGTGFVEGVGAGTASVWVDYMGESNSLPFSVVSVVKPTTLVHRLKFEDAAGQSNVVDDVGAANGVLIGPGTFTGESLVLPGGGTAATPTGGYVDLPNGIISALPGATTFEACYTWEGSGDWQRVFDFGTSIEGEDLPGGGDSYLFLSPQGADNDNTRIAVRSANAAGEFPLMESGSPPTIGEFTHVVFTYDTDDGISRMYVNGARVATDGATLPLTSIVDVNNWLGRAQWANDPIFQGQLHELDIYTGIMTDAEVQARYLECLPVVPADPPVLGMTQAGSDLILSWTEAEGQSAFAVESADAMLTGTGTVWGATATTPVETNGQKQVTVPMDTGEGYFRLTD